MEAKQFGLAELKTLTEARHFFYSTSTPYTEYIQKRLILPFSELKIHTSANKAYSIEKDLVIVLAELCNSPNVLTASPQATKATRCLTCESRPCSPLSITKEFPWLLNTQGDLLKYSNKGKRGWIHTSKVGFSSLFAFTFLEQFSNMLHPSELRMEIAWAKWCLCGKRGK